MSVASIMEAVNLVATTQRPHTTAHAVLDTGWQQTNIPVWILMSVRHMPTSAQVSMASSVPSGHIQLTLAAYTFVG